MSTPDNEPTTEQTGEVAGQAGNGDTPGQRERIATVRRAAAFRNATARAFDTRTERWQEAGLSGEIDKAESRKALREAIVLLVLIIAVIYGFSKRHEIGFITGNNYLEASRYVTAGLLAVLGWAFAVTLGKAMAPALMRRMDPATAGSVGFLFRLFTIVVVILVSLAIAGVNLAALAVGGAFTAVIVGLAAQQTLGNVIAGAVLLSTRPFRVGDLVAVQGGGINAEGTVASLGLFYTTLLMGRDRMLIPNSVLMNIAVTPQGEPDAVELLARFDSSKVTPTRLQEKLEEEIEVPLMRSPDIELEEIDAKGLVSLTVRATPIDSVHGPILASQVMRAIREVGGETDPQGQPAVDRSGRPLRPDDAGD